MFDCLRKSLSWSKMESCFEHWYALCWNKQVGYIDNCLGVPISFDSLYTCIDLYICDLHHQNGCCKHCVWLTIGFGFGGYHSDSCWIKRFAQVGIRPIPLYNPTPPFLARYRAYWTTWTNLQHSIKVSGKWWRRPVEKQDVGLRLPQNHWAMVQQGWPFWENDHDDPRFATGF